MTEKVPIGRCMECGDPVYPSRLILHEIRGFVEPRTGGGVHHVIAKKETGRLVCEDCAGPIKRGRSPKQGSLL